MRERRRRLESIELPDEHEARVRSWEVVRAAFEEREPAPRRRHLLRPALALAVVAAVAAGALSPPGRALIDSVRESIGVEEAAPALFALPSDGRVLVTSGRGVWAVRADGSKRLLGRYREASWSPFGRFVVAARANELAALDPGTGDLRWSLARPSVRRPRWGGTRVDTRIAYLSGRTLRVVIGNGEGDRLLARSAADVAPAWRPGLPHVVSYATADGAVRTVEADTGRTLWRAPGLGAVRALEWSSDGRLLLVRGLRTLRVLGADGRIRFDLLGEGRPAPVTAAALAPGGRSLAFVQRAAGRSTLWIVPRLRPDGSAARRVFSGAGRFEDVAWSPDGAWLLLAWRDADQWLFLRSSGVRKLEAVSAISRQFRAPAFPRLEGWCCATPTPGRPIEPAPAATPAVESRPAAAESRPLGRPWAGRLVAGVQLPAGSESFFTWDPIRDRVPNRAWRRWGTDRLVGTLRRVLDDFAAAHPDAPRIGIGDLSRPAGGDFGRRYGPPGHASHQNGLDADVYYPRLDRRERAPTNPAQIDRALAQELVDRFVAAGAVYVFVGPRTGLRGNPRIVQQLRLHDDHLHVRLPRDPG